MKIINDLEEGLKKAEELLKDKTLKTISDDNLSHASMIISESRKKIYETKIGIEKSAKLIFSLLSEEDKDLLRKFAEEGGQFTEHSLSSEFHKSLLDNKKIKYLIDDSRGAHCDYWWINDVGQAVLVEMGIKKPVFS